MQVLIFVASYLSMGNLFAQDLQEAEAVQTQKPQDVQIAVKAQDTQDLQTNTQAQNSQNLQTAAKTAVSENLTTTKEEKENKMEKCDFYPVTDFFNLMEQLYNNLNKMCLLSPKTANWEATGLIVLHDWSEPKAEDIPADYPHNFYISGVVGERVSRVRVELLPHLRGKKTLIPDMKFPKNIPAPYAAVPIISTNNFVFHFGSEYPKHPDLGFSFGEFQQQTAYYWAKLDGNSEMYKQTGELSFMSIPVGRSAGYEFIDLLLAVPIRDIDEYIKYSEQFRPKF